MISLRKLGMAGAAVAVLALPVAAHASQTFYANNAAFVAAAGPLVTEDFNDTTLLTGLTINSTVGNISGGVFNDQVAAPTQTTEFDLGHSSTAWGAFFDETPNGFGSGITFTITLLNNSQVVLSQELSGAAGDFFGFTSTDAFSKVLLTQGSAGGIETYNLDNMSYSGAVPEPGMWALMLVGFGGLGAAMRSNRRRTVTA